eukprot:TRINITY_DN14962_c0_g2_i3.p1 TRINITY_DN14962_c0_g2~~TRINITY_DN14962_c0_g2_i3.p1  ORF type:complete len:101 (-),score=7.12 TRINITY_DN14962_c0_g2_i3:450-752(-)
MVLLHCSVCMVLLHCGLGVLNLTVDYSVWRDIYTGCEILCFTFTNRPQSTCSLVSQLCRPCHALMPQHLTSTSGILKAVASKETEMWRLEVYWLFSKAVD